MIPTMPTTIHPPEPDDGTVEKAIPIASLAIAGEYILETEAGFRASAWGFFVQFFSGEDAIEGNYVAAPTGTITMDIQRRGLDPFGWTFPNIGQVVAGARTDILNGQINVALKYDASASFSVGAVRVRGLNTVAGATHFIVRAEGATQ